MNWGYVFTIFVTFATLLIVAQRLPERGRRMFRGFIVFMAFFLMIRFQFHVENVIGYLLGWFTSFVFWLLIGRYNPVKQESDIKVYGLDD